MSEIDATDAGLPRRTVLKGAVLAGAAAPFLAACGSGDTSGTSPQPATTDETSRGSGPSSSSSGGSESVASTADVPEGGGVILEDPPIVITQPTPGDFKAFTNVCTHQGCIVNNVTDGTINCICHGSMYSIEDGSVVGGPAPAPLAEESITVKGDEISMA